MTLAYRDAGGTLHPGGWWCEMCGMDRRWTARGRRWICHSCGTVILVSTHHADFGYLGKVTIDVERGRWIVYLPDDKDRSYATLTNAQHWCDEHGVQSIHLGPTAQAVIVAHSI